MVEKTKKPAKVNARKLEGRTHIPKLDVEKCINCLICQYTCPDLAITRHEDREHKIEIDYDICRGCGICSAMCPKDAIVLVIDED